MRHYLLLPVAQVETVLTDHFSGDLASVASQLTTTHHSGNNAKRLADALCVSPSSHRLVSHEADALDIPIAHF